MYGKELILDLHDCNSTTFTRESIELFCTQLCSTIGMQKEDLYFWDYYGEPEEYAKAPDHLKGTSAIQFITTSNITIHTLDVLGKVFLNIFSCADFDADVVQSFAASWFEGKVINKHEVDRI